MKKIAVLFSLFFAACMGMARGQADVLRAGVARINITPSIPMWLTGYASREKPASGVLEPIWAKALVLEQDNNRRIIFVTMDLLGISHAIVEDVYRQAQLKYGISRSQLLLNSSHTHSGPMIWPCLDVIYDFSESDQRLVSLYTQQLTANLISVIDLAMNDRSPAVLSSGHGQTDFAINRRNDLHPNGPVDHDVPVLKVARPDGSLKAVLFGYACHNTTLVDDNYLVNGDYAGFAQKEIEQNNPGATALFLMGCAGDQNPSPRGTAELAREHGHALAAEVGKVLQGSLHPVRAPIRTDYDRVSLEFQPVDPSVYQQDITGTNKFLQRRARLMLEAYNRGWPTDKLSYPIQAVRFNDDLTILGLGDEVVVDYSLAMKKEFAGANLYVAGYCNEVECYIPSKRILLEGGYEGGESMIYYGFPGPFAADVEDRITGTIHKVMKNLGLKPDGKGSASAYPIQLITLDPGHFHAALTQKSMYPDIDPTVHVYAPTGPEVEAHLALIEKYNTRAVNPASWNEVVYRGADFLKQMLKDKSGNVVVISGNNQKKMDYIRQCVDSGYNVLADKPMIIHPVEFPSLEKAFRDARQKKIVLYDIMTERYQITSILQRRLAALPAIFGHLQQGTTDNPAILKESVHYYLKYVSGKPLIRPDWYFDVNQEGEGIVDVTTHLIDLVEWESFPDQALDYRKDVRMLSARHWPTRITPAQFGQITGKNEYPAFLKKYVSDSTLSVFANGEMNYTLKGVHARVSVKWDVQTPEGQGDSYFSLMRGSLANLVIRQDKAQSFRPVLSIEPTGIAAGQEARYESALQQEVAKLQSDYPGLGLKKNAAGWELVIPEKYSLDHEATFAEVTKKYLQYVRGEEMPAWEVPNMLTKYYTTMKALEMASAAKK